jgi:hypothetical protein
MINHCDRPITLLGDTECSQRHSMINHCGRPFTLLSDTDTVVRDITYCISITKKSDRSITVIYHAMSLTTVSVSLRRVIGLSQ